MQPSRPQCRHIDHRKERKARTQGPSEGQASHILAVPVYAGDDDSRNTLLRKRESFLVITQNHRRDTVFGQRVREHCGEHDVTFDYEHIHLIITPGASSGGSIAFSLREAQFSLSRNGGRQPR